MQPCVRAFLEGNLSLSQNRKRQHFIVSRYAKRLTFGTVMTPSVMKTALIALLFLGIIGYFGVAVYRILDTLAPGGAIANRFDATTVTYLRQLGNLLASYSTDEVAVFAQDNWKVKPNLTVNMGIRWEGAFNPTPDASNTAVVNQVKGFQFPIGRSTDPSARIPNQLDQFAPRLGFAWDPKNDGKTVVRGYSGLYYARTPALLYAGPMNNYRLPPGDLSFQLPFIVPAGNPNNTVYEQFLLIGIDLNQTPLDKEP